MRRTVVRFVLFVLLGFSTAVLAIPENLSLAKRDIERYYQSGQYSRDLTHAVQAADAYLDRRVANNKAHKRLAVVLDIDDTVVLTYGFMKVRDFGATPAVLDAYQRYHHFPAIRPMRDLVHDANRGRVAIFFVTGRPERYRHDTIQMLKNAGYAQWAGLYMRSDGDHTSAIAYKSGIRRRIFQQGYDIVLNIGDQSSDLSGGFADNTVKLPNPMYFIG